MMGRMRYGMDGSIETMGQDHDTSWGASSALADTTEASDHPFELGAIVRSTVLFPTDRPVPASDLIGRQDEIASILEDVEQSRHRILIGSDQVGKTSVATAAAVASQTNGWHVVALDLARICDFDTLIAGLIEPASTESESEEESLGLSAAIGALDDFARQNDRRVLLYVDGFQELSVTQLFGKIAATGDEMRSALDKTEHIVCLFVGSAPTVMRDLFGTKGQPFHQFGHVTSVGSIDESAWRDALRERFNAGGCELEAAAVDRLLELGGEHARATMLIAQHTYALGAAQGRQAIGVESVEIGFQSALAAERSAADKQFIQVRTLSKHALATALRVAKGESPYKKLPPAVARQTLRGLETAGVIDRPRSGSYQIANPMLRHYLLAAADNRVAGFNGAALAQSWNAVGLLASMAAELRGGVRVAPTSPSTDDGETVLDPRADDGQTIDSDVPDIGDLPWADDPSPTASSPTILSLPADAVDVGVLDDAPEPVERLDDSVDETATGSETAMLDESATAETVRLDEPATDETGRAPSSTDGDDVFVDELGADDDAAQVDDPVADAQVVDDSLPEPVAELGAIAGAESSVEQRSELPAAADAHDDPDRHPDHATWAEDSDVAHGDATRSDPGSGSQAADDNTIYDQDVESEPAPVDAHPPTVEADPIAPAPAAVVEPESTVVEPEPMASDATSRAVTDRDHDLAPEAAPGNDGSSMVDEMLIEEVAMTTRDGDGQEASESEPMKRRRALLRRPQRDEADAIGEYVVRTMEAHDEGTATSKHDRRQASDRSMPRRLGQFIKESVASHPDRYWQLEVDDHAVGGAVLHQPTSMLGKGTSTGIDPILQAVLLVVTFVLILGGVGMLIANQAWTWGAYVGLLFAAFVALTAQLVMLAPKTFARARASWLARRNRGTVFEAVWSEPNQIGSVFQALAHKLPGTHISGYVENSDRIAAFRDLGFCVHRGRVVAGILDPSTERPVRDVLPSARQTDVVAPGEQVAKLSAKEASKSASGTKTAPAARRHVPGWKRRARLRRSPLSGGQARLTRTASARRRQHAQAIKDSSRQRAAAKKRKRAVAAKNRKANKHGHR